MTPDRPSAYRCPACGASMVRTARDDTVEHKGVTRTVPLEGWWCDACGEAVFEGPALQAAQDALNALKAEVDGLLRPAE